MNYNLPDPRKLDIGELKEMRTYLVSQLRLVNIQIEGQILSECSICEKPEFAYQSIPEGWGWLRRLSGYLLCDGCIKTYTRLHGAPDIFTDNDIL